MTEYNNPELTIASDDLTLLEAYPGYIQQLIERSRIARAESFQYNATVAAQKNDELRDLSNEFALKIKECAALQQEWSELQAEEKDIQAQLNARKQCKLRTSNLASDKITFICFFRSKGFS